MENQKYATVMSPGLAFEVLQSQDGDSLFFSIGTDNIFYLTRELTESSTGWDIIDLSSSLSSQHGGAAVAAKTFSVNQNAQTLGIDLALVLTVGGADFLYLSLNNANTDASWANGVTWTAIPFDAGTPPSPLTIADVFVMTIPVAGGTGVQNIFVDILRNPSESLNVLDRYYITPGATQQWNLHMLSADLDAGSISSCLGQRTNDPIPGIYTFGTIGSEQELQFTPQYNYFRPTSPPSPARLTLPTGASAIASALNGSGVTNLFVAGTAGLFLFTPDNQGDQATPVQVVSNTIVAGASSLAASTDANRTAVWGLAQGNLFYVMCPAGSEADPTAWSNPVPLVTQAEGFAFFLNLNASSNVLFANVDGQDLIQLTQDPVTSEWSERSILLPPTSTTDMSVYNSFTTHIQVVDDNGVAVPNAAVGITATSPVSVYINDVYYLLSPTAVQTTADLTGVITVIQETQSLSAVCFSVALTDTPSVVVNINPMSNAQATLATIQTGSDLSAVQVTNADGTQQPLVPTSVSSGDVAAAAASIKNFVTINAGLPQDGSRQSPSSAARLTTAAVTRGIVPRVWGVSFTSGAMAYHEGDDAAQRLGLQTLTRQPTPAMNGSALGSIESDIEVAAGDFFQWIKDAYDDVASFIVQEEEGIYHFLVTIGNDVYDVLLDCISAVGHAVELVFNKIEVFFDDLIKWLGFVFEWDDILRTHAVLKNVIQCYMAQCINNLGDASTQLQNMFTQVEKYIDAWAGIPNNLPPSLTGSSLDSSTASSQSGPGQNSPQSNWGLHHLKSNAASGTTTAQPNSGVLGDIESVLKPLVDALAREEDVFKLAAANFKSDIIDKIHQLTLPQIIEAVIAIIADTLLESLENVLVTAIDVLIALTDGIMQALTATIDIPVISSVYKQVTGDDLSLLDLTCLIAAIPVTIGYKLVANAAPFPDDATTTALINAPDFAAIQQIYNPVPSFTAPVSVMSKAPQFIGTTAPTGTISKADNKVLVLTGGIASLVGALSLSVFQPLAKKNPEVKIFPIINGLSYPLYVLPDIMGQIPDLEDNKWWAWMNNGIADFMIVKTLVDTGVGLTAKGSTAQLYWNPASPWVDFGANILWEVPTIAGALDPENYNAPGILNYFGGTSFDCNGIMSPVLADDSEPITWGAAVVVAALFNLAYGILSCTASVLTFEAKDPA